MTELTGDDALGIYAQGGEDVEVRWSDGRREVHQIKSGDSSGSATVIRGCLSDAEQCLTNAEADAFVIVTEVPLTKTAKALLKEAQQTKWGAGHLKLERIPDAETAWLRVGDSLRRQMAGDGIGLDDAVEARELDELVSALALLERKIAANVGDYSSGISGDAIRKAIGWDEFLSGVRTRVCGTRLIPWSKWQDLGSRGNDDVAAPWYRSEHANPRIRTAAEADVIAEANSWLTNPSEPRTLMVSGRSGTGKTWLLAAVAAEFSERADVYVLDDQVADIPPRFDALAKLSPKPPIVLVDDLRHEDVGVTLRNAMRAESPILVIASAGAVMRGGQVEWSLPRDSAEMLAEFGPSVYERPLSDTIEPADVESLAVATGRWPIPAGMSARLRSKNLRAAAAEFGIPSSRSNPFEFVRAWREEQSRAWITPLLAASSLAVRVPESLLFRSIRDGGNPAPIPRSVDNLALGRTVSEGERILWLEEQASAASISLIRSEIGLDVDREMRESALRKLVAEADHSSFRERSAARQIVRALGSRAASVLAGIGDQLIRLATHEDRTEFVYGWLPTLLEMPETSDQLQDLLAESRLQGLPPRSPVDVLVLLATLGSEGTARALLRSLPSGSIDPEVWARLLTAVDVLPNRTGRRVKRIALLAFDENVVRLPDLLTIRYAREPALKSIEQVGSPELRSEALAWLIRGIRDGSAPASEINLVFNLAERCVMQERSYLCVTIVREVLSGDIAGRLSTIESSVAELAAEEDRLQHIAAALTLSRDLARQYAFDGRTDLAIRIWLQHAAFSRRWNRADLGSFREILEFALVVSREGRRGKGQQLLVGALRGLSSTKELTPEVVGAAMKLFSGANSVNLARAYIVLVSGIASMDEEISVWAARLLGRIGEGNSEATVRAARGFGRLVAEWTGESRPLIFPRMLEQLDSESDEDLILEFLSLVRFTAPHARSVSTQQLAELANGRPPYVYARLFSEFYRREERRAAKWALAQARSGLNLDNNPEALGREVAFCARFGDLDRALELAARMYELQAEQHRGMAPATTHRALLALAGATDGVDSYALTLAASLVKTEQLKQPSATPQE